MQTLVLTDIATGWTECAPLLVREQRLLTEVLGEMRKLLPFTLLGFDTDNDSVFMNETVRDYCLAASVSPLANADGLITATCDYLLRNRLDVGRSVIHEVQQRAQPESHPIYR